MPAIAPIMVFVCQSCPERFEEAQALLSHFLSEHMSTPKSPSTPAPTLCDLPLSPTPSDSPESNEESTCKDCGKVFSSKYNLDRHVQLHKGVRYPCAICGKMYSQKYAWGQHMKAAHNKVIATAEIRSGERTWKTQARCPYCSEAFPSETAIEDHIQQTHIFPSVHSVR